jgi:hypothetical protein
MSQKSNAAFIATRLASQTAATSLQRRQNKSVILRTLSGCAATAAISAFEKVLTMASVKSLHFQMKRHATRRRTRHCIRALRNERRVANNARASWNCGLQVRNQTFEVAKWLEVNQMMGCEGQLKKD